MASAFTALRRVSFLVLHYCNDALAHNQNPKPEARYVTSSIATEEWQITAPVKKQAFLDLDMEAV